MSAPILMLLPALLYQNAFVVTLSVVVAALAWVGLLRQQLESQTRALRRTMGQLEAAKLRAEAALERARNAEMLEQQKKAVVELIACDEPLQDVLNEIVGAIEKQCDGLCSIRLEAAENGSTGAAPSLPPAWREAVEQLNVGRIRVGARYRALRELSPESHWAEFVATKPPAAQSVFALPVLSGARRVGVISLFFEEARRVSDHDAALLSSWSSLAAMALERRRLHDQLSFRALHDELTGLANRVLLFETLQLEMQRCRENRSTLALLYLDIDGFKTINDTLGHAAGDSVLQQTAERMRSSVRQSDTIARVGGDEFVILLPDLNDPSDAASIAQIVRQALGSPIYFERERLVCGASLGLSFFPLDSEDPHCLLRTADARMYEKKASSKLRKQNQSAQRLLEPQAASYFIG